jgi:hypothetical protein
LKNALVKVLSAAAVGLTFLGFANAAQGQALVGNLIVSRVGDGTATLVNTGNAVFLDQFTTSGSSVGSSMSLPSSGANAVVSSGTATSEGQLGLSSDGKYLTYYGYNTATGGSTNLTGTTSAAVNRIVARVGIDGSVDLSTKLTDAQSGNNPRTAVSVNGSTFYTAGAAGGVNYANLGATTSTQINGSNLPTNIRVLNIFGGQLYASTGSTTGGGIGIYSIGSGLPTAGGVTPTLVFQTGTSTTLSSPYDFIFKDANTVYIADDRTTGTGGLQKWTQNAGTWSLAYSALAGTAGLRSITTDGTTIYGVSTDNKLVSVTDTGSAFSAFNTLATAGTNTAFRGVRFITPVPAPPALVSCLLGAPGLALYFRRRKRA